MTCRWCAAAGHEVQDCPSVVAAFGPATRRSNAVADPSVYRARSLPRRKSGPKKQGPKPRGPSQDLYPCTVPGCDQPRATGRPNCSAHERVALRRRRQARKAAR